jgi:hypothetical protein
VGFGERSLRAPGKTAAASPSHEASTQSPPPRVRPTPSPLPSPATSQRSGSPQPSGGTLGLAPRSAGELVTAEDTSVEITRTESTPNGRSVPRFDVVVTDTAVVDHLASVFNALPTAAATAGPACQTPMTPGSVILYGVQFSQTVGSPPDVAAAENACNPVAVELTGGQPAQPLDDSQSQLSTALAQALGITTPPFDALGG